MRLCRRGASTLHQGVVCANKPQRPTSTYSLYCKVTAQIWALFTSIANINWTMPEHTTDLLSCWIKRGSSKSQKRWWRSVPACIWWTIWKERNQRIFKGKECTIDKIKWKIILLPYAFGVKNKM